MAGKKKKNGGRKDWAVAYPPNAKVIPVYEDSNICLNAATGKPVGGTALGGWYCEHAVVVAKKKGDVVLCEECMDKLDAGAVIVKQKAAKAGK